MADGTIVPNPPRIVEEDGVAGSLLRQAEDGYRASVLEPSAFRRLERRRERRAAWAQGIGAVGAAVAIALVALATRQPAAPSATVEREPVRNISVTSAPKTVAMEGPSEAPSAATALTVPVAPTPTAPAPTVKHESEAPSEAGCTELARDRKHDRALTCFRALAKGRGVEAELALYRAARLFADELGAPERAVALLDEYRTRFPEGAMRAEVDWLRIQSLERAKHFERALNESEALLGTPSGRTLSAELHLLRGRIFEASLGDCARANSEYVALLADKSSRGDEAEFRRAACLSKLGRSDDARAAFQRYLERAAPLRERAAQDRLRELPVVSTDPEGTR